MHDGRPYAIIMQSFMRFRPVVSEEMMSKDLSIAVSGTEKERKKQEKEDSKKSTKTIKIPKDSESLTRRLHLQASVKDSEFIYDKDYNAIIFLTT